MLTQEQLDSYAEDLEQAFNQVLAGVMTAMELAAWIHANSPEPEQLTGLIDPITGLRYL